MAARILEMEGNAATRQPHANERREDYFFNEPKGEGGKHGPLKPDWNRLMEQKNKLNYAGTGPFVVNMAVSNRWDNYIGRHKDINSLYYRLKIAAENVNPLKLLLFNEYYQSQNTIEGRKNEKNIAKWMFGVNGKGSKRIDSWGEFQTNIDYAVRFLSDDKNRERFISLFRPIGLGSGETDLYAWKKLSPNQKRTAAANHVLSNFGMSLFFANEMYSNNIADLAKNAATYWKGGAGADTEVTGIFRYNRSTGQTNIAIFQQNLLIEAENIIKRDPASTNANSLRELVKKFKINGTFGLTTSSMLLIVCSANRIKEADFKATFGTDYAHYDAKKAGAAMADYGKMANFFSLKEFRMNYITPRKKKAEPQKKGAPQKVQATVDRLPDFKGQKTLPLLDYDYLNDRQGYLTEYLKNYFLVFRK